LRGLFGFTVGLEIHDLAQSTAEHIAKLLTEPRFNAQIEAGILPSGTLLWRPAHAYINSTKQSIQQIRAADSEHSNIAGS